ncbi:hypothetical protein HJFPF1_11879 [Paramyrothecium foliicola]|nr:hypothetical protein HJFPF1_11879 [Paramyrothecium foliicola]
MSLSRPLEATLPLAILTGSVPFDVTVRLEWVAPGDRVTNLMNLSASAKGATRRNQGTASRGYPCNMFVPGHRTERSMLSGAGKLCW